MFYSISGKLIHTEPSMAVIDVHGIGFKCFISMNTARALPKVGDNATLFTHLHVREDALDIFGFISNRELEFYKLLTNISGVGPKVGLAILSEMTPDDISLAAAGGDSKAFAKANGVGPKLAQRIVLELKDKAGNMIVGASKGQSAAPMQTDSQAVSALVALGYSPTEAASVVSRVDSSLKTEDIIRQALRLLAMK